MTEDSDQGLAADETFADELSALRRRPETALCEMTKLAFDSCEHSTQYLATLFNIVLLVGRRRLNCTDLIIEVNPRHVRFYEIMLGFQRLGNLSTNESVGAPSQLMWLAISEIDKRIEACRATAPKVRDRSLYNMFFSRQEELEIISRLEALDAVPRAMAALQPERVDEGFHELLVRLASAAERGATAVPRPTAY